MSDHRNTKEEIIDLGRKYVQELGYHSFRYQLIAHQLNIKNAAIHHYFPAKEDLGLAIIEKDHADFTQLTRMLANESASAKIQGFINIYRSYLEDGKNLCVIGSCTSAHNELPEKMWIAAKQYLQEVEVWLTAIFREGQQKGEFTFTGQPEDMAALWMATLPGTLQLSQMRGQPYFDQVMTQLKKSLD